MSQTPYINILQEVSNNKLSKLEIDEFLKKGRNSKVEALVKMTLNNSETSSGIELIDPLIQKIIIQKIQGDYYDTKIKLFPFLDDEIILSFLSKGLITNLFIEDFFQKVRSSIAGKFANSLIINPDDYQKSIPILIAIANQCYRNEYIWEINKEDKRNLKLIVNKIENIIKNNDKIPYPLILILASFQSLNLYKNLTNHINLNINNYHIVSDIIEKQILDFKEESKIKKTIKGITKIEDSVSIKVRDQYEKNPYPRWLSVPKSKNDKTYLDYIKDSLFKKINKKEINHISNILVAGCGTGKHPVMLASMDKDIKITAIDISKTSLAYGKRMAEKLNINNISWAQADILKLDDIKKKFDAIESIGVIHHMKDPKKGFEYLSRRLKKNGLLKLGLYSRYFRQGRLNKIKEYILKKNLPHEIESVRKIRKYVFENLKNPDYLPLSRMPDYYTTSSFRDLLMHHQELDFTIPEIQEMIEDKYKFIGFTFLSNQRFENYIKKFPDDKFLNNLNNWNTYEKENPDFFSGMYQFWLQKK